MINISQEKLNEIEKEVMKSSEFITRNKVVNKYKLEHKDVYSKDFTNWLSDIQLKWIEKTDLNILLDNRKEGKFKYLSRKFYYSHLKTALMKRIITELEKLPNDKFPSYKEFAKILNIDVGRMKKIKKDSRIIKEYIYDKQVNKIKEIGLFSKFENDGYILMKDVLEWRDNERIKKLHETINYLNKTGEFIYLQKIKNIVGVSTKDLHTLLEKDYKLKLKMYEYQKQYILNLDKEKLLKFYNTYYNHVFESNLKIMQTLRKNQFIQLINTISEIKGYIVIDNLLKKENIRRNCFNNILKKEDIYELLLNKEKKMIDDNINILQPKDISSFTIESKQYFWKNIYDKIHRNIDLLLERSKKPTVDLIIKELLLDEKIIKYTFKKNYELKERMCLIRKSKKINQLLE